MRISDWSSDVCSSDLIDVIALDPRIDVARGGPIIPLSRHLADARRVRRGEVAGFGPIVRHVEKLPGPAEPGDQLPLAVPHRTVAFVLPEDRLVAMQRLPAKGRSEAAPLHRHDIMAVEGLGIGDRKSVVSGKSV